MLQQAPLQYHSVTSTAPLLQPLRYVRSSTATLLQSTALRVYGNTALGGNPSRGRLGSAVPLLLLRARGAIASLLLPSLPDWSLTVFSVMAIIGISPMGEAGFMNPRWKNLEPIECPEWT